MSSNYTLPKKLDMSKRKTHVVSLPLGLASQALWPWNLWGVFSSWGPPCWSTPFSGSRAVGRCRDLGRWGGAGELVFSRARFAEIWHGSIIITKWCIWNHLHTLAYL